MVQDNHNEDQVNRRKILGSIGAFGLAGTGIVGAATDASESKRKPSSDRIRKIRASPQFQQLEAELGKLPLSRDRARYNSIEAGEYDLHVTKAKTPIGTLTVGELGDKKSVVALKLKEGQMGDTEHSQQLPEKYQNLPGSGAMLIGLEDRVEFRREATQREHNAVAGVSGINPDQSYTIVGTDFDGFHIIPQSTEGSGASKSDGYIVTIDSLGIDGARNDIPVESMSASQLTVAAPGSSEVRPEDWKDCLSECAQCLAAVGSVCASCRIPCAGGPTGWGLILCVACIKGACEIGSIAICYQCFDCIGEYT